MAIPSGGRDRWARLEQIFHDALAQVPDRRAEFVASACGTDADLRLELETLLQQHDAGESLFDRPVVDHAIPGAVWRPGTKVGSYEITGRLGAGGMGEVFSARDTRLGRDVALKTLPPAVARDVLYLERLRREARVLASLNHPNIATLHGIEESGGAFALVMELVEGQTLKARLSTRRLSVAEAVGIALQVCEALENAHGKGIVHRDLKPGNVIVGPGGRVKVLDFGLAKATAVGHGDAPTGPGTILGTAGYMAPEQLEGGQVDVRADIFAFGALLYEMIAGRKAFSGCSEVRTLTAVLHEDPEPVETHATGVSPGLARLIRMCLRKDPARRVQNITDVKLALEEIRDECPPVQSQITRSARFRWIVAGCFGVAAMVALLVPLRTAAGPDSPFVQLDLDTGAPVQAPAVSHDGTLLAFNQDGRIALRRLDQNGIRFLPGTEQSQFPFFSPNGRWIGFFSKGKLRKISVDGDGLQAIADAPGGRGGVWLKDDSIVFSPEMTGGLVQVQASGGKAERIIEPTGIGYSYRWPSDAPGHGRLFFVSHGRQGSEDSVLTFDLSTRTVKVLVDRSSGARYLAGGRVVYFQNGNLLVAPLDDRRLELSGPAAPLATHVSYDTYWGALFGASPNGVIVYRRDLVGWNRRLAWLDSTGRLDWITGEKAAYAYPNLSPDGRRLAITMLQDGKPRLWIRDLERNTMQPIGADSDETDSSVWSRDGAFLLFRVNDALGWVPAEGTGPIHKLEGELRGGATPRLMTPDGRLLLLYRNYERGTDSGGWWVAKISLSDGRLALTEPKQLAGHKEHEGFLISPDGQWLAYNSMESGRREAYVTPFKLSGKPDKSWLVSTQGGYPLAWSKTGRQLFYMSNGLIYVASWSARGDEFIVGQARPWTNTKIRGMGAVKLLDFAPDEKRWIVLADDTEVLPETHLRLLLNVNQELNRRAAKAGGTK